MYTLIAAIGQSKVNQAGAALVTTKLAYWRRGRHRQPRPLPSTAAAEPQGMCVAGGDNGRENYGNLN